MYAASSDSIYLSPAPLYHSAPIGFNTGFQALGATSIVMEKFDPEVALKFNRRIQNNSFSMGSNNVCKVFKK